ncbi:MAG: response regulator transcription factor [Caldilineaceae bacterium]|nr:response regulator transcription factor [Caldilineaceae bacterium]
MRAQGAGGGAGGRNRLRWIHQGSYADNLSRTDARVPDAMPVEQLALAGGTSYNGPMPEERILIVDDDREIVRLLRSYLQRERYAVSVAYDGETAIHVLRRESPDLMLLDLMLPDRDGWEVTRTVRGDEKLANTLIIMLTARVEDTDKIIGLELGADDYITKPFNPREVVARVRALLRRSQRTTVRAPTLVVGALKMDVERRDVQVRDIAVELTPTEFSLLQTLMESPGYVFTRTELMDRALGYDYSGVDRMLDSHIKNLRRKIEADPRKPQLVQTVYGVGYRLAGERE